MNTTFKSVIRHITVALVFLVPVLPLIVANDFFFPFITGKAFYFRILVQLAFAGWLFLAFLDAKYRPRLTPLTIGITIFTLVTLVADLLGVNPLRSIWSNFERMEGWITIIHLWGFFILTSSLFGHEEHGHLWWRRWFNVSIGVAFIVGIYGLFQVFGWAVIHQGSTRIDASLGNAAYMAVYMLIHAFLAGYMFFHSRVHKTKSFSVWMYGFLTILFAFLVFETATRGTILGLIGGTLVALGVYSVFGRHEPKKKRIISLSCIGLIILIGAVFWINRDAQFVKNSEILSRMASISWNETKTQARGYIWPMALRGVAERPILGWGQENFNYIFNANYEPRMWNQEQWFDRAHNVFLDWLVASGIVGFLSYISLYVLAVLAIWRSNMAFSEKSVLFGLISGYAIHNIFVFDNLASYMMFMAVLGFSSSFEKGRHIKWFEKIINHKEAFSYVIAPIIIVLLVLSMYFVNIRTIQANTRLITALQACANGQPSIELFDKTLEPDSYTANQEIREQLLGCVGNILNSNRPNDVKQTFFDFALRELNSQVEDSPEDARVFTLGGYFFALVGDLPRSAQFLEKAVELSPDKQSIALQLATVYLNIDKMDEALALYKQSYEADKSYPAAKEAYIRALIAANKEADARRMFAETDPDLFETEVVAEIYMSLDKHTQGLAIYDKLVAASPKDVELKIRRVRALIDAGMKARAIQRLQEIAAAHPETKADVEATIKQIQ